MLLIGNMLNGLYFIPYNLQLAHGWTRFTININVIALVVLVPVIYLGVSRLGAVAAAGAWILLNASYIFVAVPLVHRRLLRTEKWRWYWQDVLGPFAAIFAGVLVVRVLAGPADPDDPVGMAATLGVAVVAAAVCAAVSVRRVRVELRAWLCAK
jgi:O-antigen/teichoic acid export membrane protein